MTGVSNHFEDHRRRMIATGMPGCMPQSDHEVIAEQPISATGQYLRPILDRASVKPKVVETKPKKVPRSRRVSVDEDELGFAEAK